MNRVFRITTTYFKMKTLLRLHQTSLAIMKETTVFDFLMSNIFTEEEETLKIFTFFTNVVQTSSGTLDSNELIKSVSLRSQVTYYYEW